MNKPEILLHLRLKLTSGVCQRVAILDLRTTLNLPVVYLHFLHS